MKKLLLSLFRLEGIDVDCQYDIAQLIPIKYQPVEIPVLKSPSSDKTKKFKLQWPGSESAIDEGELR